VTMLDLLDREEPHNVCFHAFPVRGPSPEDEFQKLLRAEVELGIMSARKRIEEALRKIGHRASHKSSHDGL
jgi:hypothetical protein